MSMRAAALVALLLGAPFHSCCTATVTLRSLHDHDGATAADPLDAVLGKARDTLNGTFNAGGSYSDVWARDTATFITVAAKVNPPAVCEKVTLAAVSDAHGVVPIPIPCSSRSLMHPAKSHRPVLHCIDQKSSGGGEGREGLAGPGGGG